MFESVNNQKFFTENKFTKGEKAIILTFGTISAIAGMIGTWLEIIGEYERMGLLFFVWILLQTPVNIVSLLIFSIFGGSLLIYFLLTFLWWFSFGSFVGFTIFFFVKYFESIYVE